MTGIRTITPDIDNMDKAYKGERHHNAQNVHHQPKRTLGGRT